MVYFFYQKGQVLMDKQLWDFCRLPNIENYENCNLLTLSETCAVLEERVYELAKTLPEEKQMLLDDYIRTRNDLEVETFKAALRWGKHNYK